MNQIRKGVIGLQLYNPESKKWGQAHTQGAFVYAMYLYKNQQTDLLKFEIDKEKNTFLIHLNKDEILTEG